MEIAIYGKGGIGKSTISANLSAAMAKNGNKILQVGCDPKQDSTRLLLNGERIPSALEYIKETNPTDYKLEDIIYEGLYGINCVEAGGPEPGVGCAGRGILTTFELLETLGVKDRNYDGIIYDVLGDVVCGGFAVPIRQEYAKKIYIVTSGEFMSIYAANNILKGIKNYDSGTNRVGGIIYNARGLKDEDERLKRFSEAVELPILEYIPRSEYFGKSERQSKCVMEMYPESDVCLKLSRLADTILNQEVLYEAKPVDVDVLEEKVLLTEKIKSISPKKIQIKDHKESKSNPSLKKKEKVYSKNVSYKEPLHGCAYSGAASVATQIRESATISHGPDSCSHITYQNITSLARRTLLERGITLPIQTSPPFYSSEMDENVMIFGGLENLFKTVEEVKKTKVKVIFVVTTCPSGIIGDNVERVKELEEEGIQIVPIYTDGNISGDYLQGILMAYIEIGRSIIDKEVKPDNRYVNIIGEKSISNATEFNYKFVEGVLDKLGVKVKCRYIHNSNYESIRNFKRGDLNLLAYDDYMGRSIKDFLVKEYDSKFIDRPFPVGYDASIKWVEELCTYLDKMDLYDEIISGYKKEYEKNMAIYRKQLRGKKLMIISYNQNIDWVLRTAIDLDMEISFLGILDFSQEDTFKSDYMEEIKDFKMNYDSENRLEDIRRINPDILLTNYSFTELDQKIFSDTIPLSPTVGFFSGLYFAKRWSDFFEQNLMEGWKKDEDLFRKYFS